MSDQPTPRERIAAALHILETRPVTRHVEAKAILREVIAALASDPPPSRYLTYEELREMDAHAKRRAIEAIYEQRPEAPNPPDEDEACDCCNHIGTCPCNLGNCPVCCRQTDPPEGAPTLDRNVGVGEILSMAMALANVAGEVVPLTQEQHRAIMDRAEDYLSLNYPADVPEDAPAECLQCAIHRANAEHFEALWKAEVERDAPAASLTYGFDEAITCTSGVAEAGERERVKELLCQLSAAEAQIAAGCVEARTYGDLHPARQKNYEAALRERQEAFDAILVALERPAALR